MSTTVHDHTHEDEGRDVLELYRDEDGQWRWRLEAYGNHARLANGGEGYVDFDDALAGALRSTGTWLPEDGVDSAKRCVAEDEMNWATSVARRGAWTTEVRVFVQVQAKK